VCMCVGLLRGGLHASYVGVESVCVGVSGCGYGVVWGFKREQ